MRHLIFITCFVLMCLLLVPLSGCITMREMRFQKQYKKYQPKQYPREIHGKYFGKFESGRQDYTLYYFYHFPWAGYDRGGDAMAIVVSKESNEEPIFIYMREHLDPYPYIKRFTGKNVRMSHSSPQKNKSLTFPEPGSDGLTDVPAMLFVTASDTPPPDVPPIEGVTHFVHLKATKYGPGSILRVGELNFNGRLDWGEPQMITGRPSNIGWYSRWVWLGYPLTGALDVVTAPFQIFLWFFNLPSPLT